MSFRGELREFELPDILQLIASQKKAGWLKIISKGVCHFVFFRDGKITSTKNPADEADPLEVPRGAEPAPSAEAVTAEARLDHAIEGFRARGYVQLPVLATALLEEPSFDPAVVGRGALCPALTWMVITGLHRYGFDEEAIRLTEVLKRLVLEHGPRQGYHAMTGEGIGEVDPVTASVVLHLVLAPFTVAQISHF